MLAAWKVVMLEEGKVAHWVVLLDNLKVELLGFETVDLKGNL